MESPHCPECGAEMRSDADTCPSCGEKVVPQFTPEQAKEEQGAFYCYRHKREVTRLRCGRCGRAICHRCAIIGPAGPRCPECGRARTPIRARAVAHEAKRSIGGLFAGPMRFVWIIVLLGLVGGTVNTCIGLLSQDRTPPPVETEEP